jgi:4-amino-4-deoxy-L-arabinose transferase-like glycosyltransferase
LACFAKGIQGLMPVGGLFFFALFTKNLLPLLKNKHTYIGILLFILLIGGFYFARESVEPGYLKAVWHNEAGGRFLTVLEEHSGGFWYYWDFIRDIQFPAFVWLLPVCFVFNLLFKNKEARKANLYLGLLAVFYFIMISISKTKLEWYSLPLIPFFASIIGLALSQIYFFVSEKWILISAKRNKDSKNSIFVLKTLMLAIILSLFYNPYVEIVKHNLAAKEDENNVAYYSRVNLMKMIADKESQNRYKELSYIIEERTQLDFFYHYYMKDRGIQIKVKPFADLKVGDYVQVNNPETLEKIQQHYETEETDFLVQSRILLLKSEKQENDGLISDNTEL